jgi:lycopene cyclase domain-containing protein
MTYFQFLIRFILPPLLILLGLNRLGRQKHLPHRLSAFHPLSVILAHVLAALVYTTPWDNYLVATGVWWYHLDLVAGITLGWVPIEEYIFFILQTLMTGLWFTWLARKNVPSSTSIRQTPGLRWSFTLALGAIWLVSVGMIAASWQPGTYLGLILIWALPPVMLQTAFGADILLQEWRLVLPGVLIPTLYLSLADSLAIRAGTWTISPDQTTGIHLPGGLPLEEFIFFLTTNLLVVFGTTLVLARKSQERVPPAILQKIISLTGLRQTENQGSPRDIMS